jgi:hypothetical protein
VFRLDRFGHLSQQSPCLVIAGRIDVELLPPRSSFSCRSRAFLLASALRECVCDLSELAMFRPTKAGVRTAFSEKRRHELCLREVRFSLLLLAIMHCVVFRVIFCTRIVRRTSPD